MFKHRHRFVDRRFRNDLNKHFKTDSNGVQLFDVHLFNIPFLAG